MRAFADIQIGDKEKVRHRITTDDITRFAALTGDDNKLHIDKQFAAATQFMKPIAHGMLGAAFISTLIGTKLPGDGALWHRQTLEFVRPVYEGDAITVTATVTSKKKRTKTIVLDVIIRNHRRQVVTRGEAHVKVLSPQPEKVQDSRNSASYAAVLVVGGSGGIGTAVAQELGHRARPVAVHCHSDRNAASSVVETIRAGSGEALVVEADVRKSEEMEDAARQAAYRLGGLDGLVYCVTSPLDDSTYEELSWQDFEEALDIELRGAWNAVQSVLPHMKERGEGSIVFLSTQAVDTPSAEWMPYITAKSALEGLARSLAVALAPYSIRVNIVAPGMTDTKLIAGLPSIVKTRIQATAPMKRLADPKDIAGVIAFLLSRDSSYCTGETIRVNGGQVMR
ncbi:SDR family oxidoreductase [bacterium]|nr:SDR family oxidoreductase [bacterium]